MAKVEDGILAALNERKAATLKAYVVNRAWETKTAGAYESHIWSYMREFYTTGTAELERGGGGAAFEFIDSMANEIDNQFTRAWNEGARAAGVMPTDFEQDDIDELAGKITEEQNRLDGIAGDIEAFIAEGGHTDAEFNKRFRSRAGTWANAYNRTVTDAKLWFGGKKRFEWVLGPTEQHCHVGDHGKSGAGCADLAGIVAWGREWDTAGIRPQSQQLNCSGFNCECDIKETDKRRTPNALGKILDIMAAGNV